MPSNKVSEQLMSLLVNAAMRELKVSVQYMLQHALYTGKNPSHSRAEGFIGSHRLVFLPGRTLKKIAITEMRHAEAVVERISHLGGKPLTQLPPLVVGNTARQILDIDKAEEEEAIRLYNQIINTARNEEDYVTEKLFKRILSDEEDHLQTFFEYLKEST